jgi:hypothetical protein
MQKRIDIRAGRRISMQQLIRGTHTHEHEMPEVDMPLTPVVEETPVSTHMLVDKENGDVLEYGTEYEMRKLRAKLGAADYSVKKVK